MTERENDAPELYRVRGEAMLFNDRVYETGEIIAAEVVGTQALLLVTSGHLEPVESNGADDTIRERLVGSVSKLLGRLSRAR
jgi:hypothetical protein